MNVFITGGTSGIGLELALLYRKCGHNVGVCGRDQKKLLAYYKDYDFDFYRADVSNNEQIKEVIEHFSKKYKKIDLIIANAGIGVSAKKKEQNFDEMRMITNINLNGVINTFEHSIKHMKSQGGGHLAAIASVAGLVGLPGVGAYSASKSGVIKLCESLSVDLKNEGITISCICPGFIDTPLTKRNKHPMPFLVDSQKAAQLIKRAIDDKVAMYVFPFRMKIVMTFLSLIPRSLYRMIMGFKMFNYSR